jgi:citrate lyase beta subunit
MNTARPQVRPRRSVLYMPGANTRALEKARTLPADALIFDLEDAVAPDAKESARTNVVLAAESKAYGKREIVIRCNGLGTPWGEDDIRAIATSGADAILVPKVESVYNDIKDAEGFRAACLQGVEMGFDGKTLIHPSQVEPCNDIFAPSPTELEMAGKIVVAFKAAQAEGKGVVTVDGRMIENLHVEQAERALALAAAIKELQAA